MRSCMRCIVLSVGPHVYGTVKAWTSLGLQVMHGSPPHVGVVAMLMVMVTVMRVCVPATTHRHAPRRLIRVFISVDTGWISNPSGPCKLGTCLSIDMHQTLVLYTQAVAQLSNNQQHEFSNPLLRAKNNLLALLRLPSEKARLKLHVARCTHAPRTGSAAVALVC